MQAELTAAFGETVRAPRAGVTRVLGWHLPRNTLWMAAMLVAVASALLQALLVLAAPQVLEGPQMIPSSPFLQTLIYWGALVLTVFGTHYIGRMFGGGGAFDQSLAAVVWLQGVLLAFQVLQIVLLVVAPALAAMFSIALFGYTIWLFVNFIAVVHGFKSLVMVLAGFLGASIGIGIGLLVIFSVLALLLGIDISNV